MTAMAWYFMALSHTTREMYALLSDMCGERAYYGTNPARTLLDGFLMTIMGALIMLVPIVGLIISPIGIPVAYFFNRKEWDQMKNLVAEKRIDWSRGRIKDPVENPHGPEEE